MKRILFIFLYITVLLSACRKYDNYAFDQSPDERINKALATYQTKLTGAAFGWKAYITVDSNRGGTYSFYFKFNDQNRVTMVSDFDTASAINSQESSFRLKAQQQPTLIFDTYSYLHVLADPNEGVILGLDGALNADVNGGPVGRGLLSDFEFIFDNSLVGEDTIQMNGKVHGSRLVLIKATKAESDIYLGGQFQLFAQILNEKILTYFKRFIIGAQQYDITVNEAHRTITFTWVDASGAPHIFTTGYYNQIGGIGLKVPLINGTQSIASLSNIVFNQGSGTISLNVGGQNGVITPIVVPLYIDKQAASRWWQIGFDKDAYWFSWDGFHVNGIDDGHGLNTLGSYYYLIYWPAYGNTNDLFAPVFLNAAGNGLQLRYGAAPNKPTFTPDGRAVFTLVGNYGTYPAIGPARLARNQLLIPEGFYFVMVNDSEYDMVSAKDGLSWVNWTFIR